LVAPIKLFSPCFSLIGNQKEGRNLVAASRRSLAGAPRKKWRRIDRRGDLLILTKLSCLDWGGGSERKYPFANARIPENTAFIWMQYLGAPANRVQTDVTACVFSFAAKS